VCRQEQIATGQGRRHRTGKWLEFIVRRARVNQTSNSARRLTLAIACLSTWGGSLSQPSDAMITTAPRSTLACGGTSRPATLPPSARQPAVSELVRFIMTPRCIQAMIRGSGVGVTRFRPKIHVTLWS
jgi:hypothetical protein